MTVLSPLYSLATSACYAVYARGQRTSSNSSRRERSTPCAHHLRCSRGRRALAHVCTGTRKSRPVTHGSKPICTSYSRYSAGDRTLLPHSRANEAGNSRSWRQQTAQQSTTHDANGSKLAESSSSAVTSVAYLYHTFFRLSAAVGSFAFICPSAFR